MAQSAASVIEADGVAIGGDGVAAGEDHVVDIAVRSYSASGPKNPGIPAKKTLLRVLQFEQGHAQTVEAADGVWRTPW